MTPPLWQKVKRNLRALKEKSEKADSKLNIQKTKIMASDPTTSWQTDVEKVETVSYLVFLGSKITAVTAVMKLTEACCLEGKLWQT